MNDRRRAEELIEKALEGVKDGRVDYDEAKIVALVAIAAAILTLSSERA